MKHSPGFLAISEKARKLVKEIEPEEVLAKLKSPESKSEGDDQNFHFVDVREESEWNAGHLPKAIHLSKGIIERDIETKIPNHDAHIVLYCGGGYRSALAAKNLQEMGYTNVESMAGGYRGWTERKLPLRL